MNRSKLPTLQILVVDDHLPILELIKAFISKIRCFAEEVAVYSTCLPGEALAWAKSHHFDIAFIDYKMPGMDGLELMRRLKSIKPESYLILMSAHADMHLAIKSIRSRVFDFLPKPFKIEEFELSLRRVQGHKKMTDQISFYEDQQKDNFGKALLIGQSEGINNVRKKISLFAGSNAPVLITGETGVGKGVVSRMIHSLSRRKKSSYLAINCGAIVGSLLESEFFGHEKGAFTGADVKRAGKMEDTGGGTILLDEITEIPPSLQVKLLRVLEEKEFERVGSNKTIKLRARVLAATNRDIDKDVQTGRFRKDLYFRLNTFQLHIPPLRERKNDIELLALHFLKKFSSIYNKEIPAICADAINIFHEYSWPGNVREFANIMDYAVLLCNSNQVCVEHLPEQVRRKAVVSLPAISVFQGYNGKNLDSAFSGEDIPGEIDSLERRKIMVALERLRWNKTKTAASLGLTRGQLLYRMKKYGLK